MTHYYLKELLGAGFIVQGQRVPWEPLDGNQGVVKLDDSNATQKMFAEGLAKVTGKYGIVKITEAQYNEKKKRQPFRPEVLESKKRAERLQVIGRPPNFKAPKDQSGVAAVASKMSREQVLEATASLIQAARVPDDSGVNTFRPATGKAR